MWMFDFLCGIGCDILFRLFLNGLGLEDSDENGLMIGRFVNIFFPLIIFRNVDICQISADYFV